MSGEKSFYKEVIPYAPGEKTNAASLVALAGQRKCLVRVDVSPTMY